ncbi:MAG: GspH/FimT family pseudopilin [Gammaproteobacteria bacterium]|nr:GspH/FimT family pseudopilin [Gammaproteobacteria bacterium]MBU1831572.1 GspH/FimT family pseudopilin [Gammaproteobacteria bacterium]
MAIKGFTLIELLTTVAVVGILLGVAVPNFTSFIANSRARSDVQQLSQSFVAAKSEAVVRASAVIVTATGGDWKLGWRSWVDANANGAIDSGEVLKRTDAIKSGASVTVVRDGSAITEFAFDRNSALAGGLQPVSIQYRTSPEYCSRDRNIEISASGQVRITERDCS